MNKNPLIKKQEKTLQPNKRKSTRTLRNPDRSSLLISNMQWHRSIHRKLYGHIDLLYWSLTCSGIEAYTESYMVIHLYLKRQEELKSAVTHFMYGKPIQAIHHLFIVEAKPCTTKLQQCFFLSLGKNERKKIERERGR